MNHIRLIILLPLFILTGCFYWSGVIDSQDKNDFETTAFSYFEDVYYTEKDYDEFVEDIFQEHLSDIAKRIKDEHILLPPIKILEFAGWGIASKRDAKKTTKLIADLLKRIQLFQSISIGLPDDNTNNIFVQTSIRVYKKFSHPPHLVGAILAIPSLTIITPGLHKEIVSIEFVFLSEESVINQSVGFGGGFAFISTQWFEDEPSIYNSTMKRIAFCTALRNLILNILEQRNNFDNKI